ncbi:hypothetical protein O6H91_03G116200 [Diphasiastrum complanatum]|uniref:Uncharacterized protein n=2 Tax=Diphasiastrum complanatum TaxID=34168 RepID=A0ACC2EAF9_DIPCM|nr:hypothetical protein O6H91_03G116200 [Diphasiastrum complanatum]KAJ7563594.1 hypothetical protein O6H91_03G116200 [Diphasiastrum complanatum]
MTAMDFLSELSEANRFKIDEIIGKGSYGVVCSATDTHTGEKVAIKKISDIFEYVSDASRILREIKLLRMLNHPDIVKVKHILLPPSPHEFKDIYVVFELMESDLHEVIKANDDFSPQHYQFFLYQLLRGLKYLHSAKVFHRDLKPKNVLANSDCKLKLCDFGLARVDFNEAPTTVFWTDYVATRWYRAPELCGSFFSKYTQAVDIWSIGCIFAEVLTGKPLFPGKNAVHQLDLMTDLLGTPSPEFIASVRNEKVRSYLESMHKKIPIPFYHKFPNADPLALSLLEKMLSFNPMSRPTAEEALAHPYFKSLAKVDREPSTQPIAKLEFEFEKLRLTRDDVRKLIYREILEYHPLMLKEFIKGTDHAKLVYPSDVDPFRREFSYLERHLGENDYNTSIFRKHSSSPRSALLFSEAAIFSSSAKACRTSSKDQSFEFRKTTVKDVEETENHWQGTECSTTVTARVSHASPHIWLQGKQVKPIKAAGLAHSVGKSGIKSCTATHMLVRSATFTSSQYPAPVYT